MPRIQFAFDPLFSFEQYSAGNFSIGRGYDPGTIIGDSGIGSGFELRLPRVQPFRKLNLAFQPFGFTDIAAAWSKRVPDPTRSTGFSATDTDYLVSVGGGFRALLNNSFRIDGTVAVPLKAAGLQTHNHDPRFLVSVTTKLWPWEDQ